MLPTSQSRGTWRDSVRASRALRELLGWSAAQAHMEKISAAEIAQALRMSLFFYFLISLEACLKTPVNFVFKCIYGNGLNPLHVGSVCFPRPQQIIYGLVTLLETEKPTKSHSKAWKSNY